MHRKRKSDSETGDPESQGDPGNTDTRNTDPEKPLIIVSREATPGWLFFLPEFAESGN